MARALLIGPIQQENLALQYLAGALRAAGHEAEVVPYSYRSELEAAVRRVIETAPDLVGLGLAFQNHIDDYLALMRALRPAGYRGHLTCGGHVPTFCHEELLRDVPDLDSAVRHEGEETIVEMMNAISRGEEPRGIAGLVWRNGDSIECGPVRAPVLELDRLPIPARSQPPYVVGGFVVDFVITARGCIGECHYCSIAAFTSEQGVPFRIRKPEAVAEEIAAQVKARGARVIFVQDDLFILPSEKKTVERCERIRQRLDELGVGDVVFWIKGRPETITPKVAEAARRMGAIHMFLGVENAAAQRLDYLGRTHLPIHNDSAIERLRAASIVPSFNFMLFDPDCSLGDIEATIDLAERHLDLPWNVCRTEVYSGTQLLEQLRAEGRLEGDYRSYGYLMRDERAEVMFRILRVAFHERALAVDSLLNRLISLSFGRQLHDHFYPGEPTERLSRAISELTVEVRRDTVERLRSLLAYVREADVHDRKAVRRYALEIGLAIGRTDHDHRRRTDDLWRSLNARGIARERGRGALASLERASYAVAAGS